jgi:heme ABC exporter ATP-binding subunit CcmA
VSATEPFLQLDQIAKRYGRTLALRDAGLRLAGGEALAVLGANGAGKTTLLRVAALLTRPTRGTLRAFGVDAWLHRSEVRARLGVVAHQPYVYPELTCRENVRFFATMFAVAQPDAAAVAALERVGLAARADERASALSRGLLQRLNLARAIVHAPAVLILDEPDTGLDAAGRELLAALVAEQVGRGASVVLTSHNVELALRAATRAVVLAQGGVVAERATRDLSIAEVDGLLAAPEGRVG